MERPRVWSNQLKLPCALEHAVLCAKVYRRAETWTPSFIQKASLSAGNCHPGAELENDIVLPPEDPLLVALDSFRKHYDEADAGTADLRCWAKLMGKNELFRLRNENDEVEAEADDNSKSHDEGQRRDRLVVYEISDGILTKTGSLLNGIPLRGTSFSAVVKRYD